MAVNVLADKSHAGRRFYTPAATLEAPLLFETTGRW
jgi:hypothetical protein